MQIMISHRRPGRPAIPKKDRGQRPYDPRWGTPRRLELIFALHLYREELKRGDLTHCELAKHLSTSISYLSTTKNCPWGQDMLRRMVVLERDKIAKAEGSEN